MVRGLSGCPAWASRSPSCLTVCMSPPARRAVRSHWRDLDRAAAAGSRSWSASSAASTSTAHGSRKLGFQRWCDASRPSPPPRESTPTTWPSGSGSASVSLGWPPRRRLRAGRHQPPGHLDVIGIRLGRRGAPRGRQVVAAECAQQQPGRRQHDRAAPRHHQMSRSAVASRPPGQRHRGARRRQPGNQRRPTPDGRQGSIPPNTRAD
jgi:hypothetical protein